MEALNEKDKAHLAAQKMHLQIIRDYAGKGVNFDVPKVVLYRKNGALLGEAKGRIAPWEQNSLALALTELEFDYKELMRLMVEGKQGSYIPESAKLRALGLANDFEFEANDLYVGQFSIGADQVLLPISIRFSSAATPSEFSRMALTSQHGLFLPLKNDHGKDWGTDFYRGLPYYCGTFDIGNVSYELRAGDEGVFYRTLTELPPDEQSSLESAMLLAASFCSGTKIHTNAIFEARGNYQCTLFQRKISTGSTVYNPLQWIADDTGYNMLSCLTQFLNGPDSYEIAKLLEIFVLVPSPIDVGVRTLTITILIEALIDSIIEMKKLKHQTELGFRDGIESIIKHLPHILTPEIYQTHGDRILNAIKKLRGHSRRENLELVANNLNIAIQESEYAVLRLRNQLAHGVLSHPYDQSTDSAQESLDSLAHATNLFNKLVLAAAGYHGRYADYSGTEWADGYL